MIDIDTECELLFVQIILNNQINITVGSFCRPDWTDEKYIDDFPAPIAKVNPVPTFDWRRRQPTRHRQVNK